MAYSYDGYLRFNTELDQSGFEKGAETLEKSAKSRAAKLAAEYKKQGMNSSDAFKKAWSEIERDSKNGADSVKTSLGSLSNAAALGAKAVAAGWTAATGAVTAVSTYAIAAGSNFEAAMSTVQATSQASADDMELLAAKAKEMGATTKFSATESAEALNFMAQAGWNTQAMLEGLPGVMNLAAASGEDLASVSDIVTDAITAFGLKASDSARFADVLAQAAASSNTDIAKMGATFKYVAPLAGTMKYSIEDTAVAIGLMANAGIKGEMAGTQLRAMLTRLVSPTKDSAAAMEALKMSVTNSDGTMKDFATILTDLRSGMAGYTDEQKASYAAMLGGQEAMSGLLAIANASETDFQNLTHAINNSSGAAVEMAKTVNDNLKGDLTILGSTAESVGIKVYEKFQVPMRNAAQAATDSLGEVLSSLNSGQLDKSVDKIADSAGNLLAKTADLAASGLPKLLNGFTYIIDHGKQVESVVLGAAAAVGIFKTKNQIEKVTEVWGKITKAILLETAAAKASVVAQADRTIAIGITTTAQVAQTTATGLATRAWLTFNASLAANPIGWAAIAIGALTAGLVYLATQESDTEKETKKLNEALEEQQKAREESEKARQETIDGSLAEINHAGDLIDKLKGITDANGKVKEGYEGRAKALRDQINKIIPDAIQLSENEGKMYLQVADNLDLLMQKKRLNALLDANQEAYNDAIKNQGKYVDDLRTASEKLTVEKEKQKKIEDEMAKGRAGGALLREKKDIDEKISTLEKAVKTAEDALSGSAKTIEDYEDLIAASASDNIDIITNALDSQIQGVQSYTNKNKEEMDTQLSNTAGNYEALLNLAVKNGGQIRDTELNLLIEKREALQKEVEAYLGTGEKIPQNLKDGILSTEQEFVTAINSLYENGKITAEQKTALMGAIGGQWAFALGDGIESDDSKTKITTATELAVNAAITAANTTLGIENDTSSKGKEIGGYYVDGISIGLSGRDAITKVQGSGTLLAYSMDKAVRKALGISSPAKAGIAVGEFYDDGVMIGVIKNKEKVIKAVQSLSDDSIKSATEKSGSYKELGSMYIDQMKTGINTQRDSLINQIEKLVDDNTEKHIEALGKDNDKAKTKYREAATELMDTYKKALQAGADGAVTLVSEKIQGITEEAQKQYDEIIKQRERMQDKLSDFGDLFTRDEEGKVQLENINKQTDALKRYQEALEKLQEKGISEGLLQEILDLGVEDGTDLAEKLLKNDGVFQRYNEAWTLKQEAAKAIAEKFYADELTTLDEDFTQKLDTALASIPEECTNVGVDAIQGVIKGMNDQKGEAVQTAKDIADAIIKELKRATETASPSKRAAREVGKPITQGVIKGMNDAYDPQELQAYTDRMMVDIGVSQSKAATQSVSYMNTSNSVSNSSVYNGGDFILKIEKMVNDGKGSVSSLLQEAEFYRKQKVSATGGA